MAVTTKTTKTAITKTTNFAAAVIKTAKIGVCATIPGKNQKVLVQVIWDIGSKF